MKYFIKERRAKRKNICNILLFILGIYLGYVIANILRDHFSPPAYCPTVYEISLSQNSIYRNSSSDITSNISHAQSAPLKLLLIGVFIPSDDQNHAQAIRNTWANATQNIIFFSSRREHTWERGTDDPTFVEIDILEAESPKTTYAILNHMHSNYINSYQYFMKVQSDSYVIMERLESILRLVSRTSTRGAEGGNMFCVQGENMILSRDALNIAQSHFQECLQSSLINLFKKRRVEECLKDYTGVDCLQPKEVNGLFYHAGDLEYSQLSLEAEKLFRTAALIHSVKGGFHLHHLHKFAQSLFVRRKEFEIVEAQREITRTILRVQALNHSLDDVPPLDFPGEGLFLDHLGYDLDVLSKFRFGDYEERNPNETFWFSDEDNWNLINRRERGVVLEKGDRERPAKDVLHQLEYFMLDVVNRNTDSTQNVFQLKHLQYSYFRHCPYFGIQYIPDIVVVGGDSKKIYRKHSYIQIPFGPLYVRESHSRKASSQRERDVVLFDNKQDKTYDSNPVLMVEESTKDEVIYMILALSGRFNTFQRFMEDFEREVLSNSENVIFTIVLYGPDEENRVRVQGLVSSLRQLYPEKFIVILEGDTTDSKASALKLGTSVCTEGDLIFFIDVDVTFTSEVFHRIRWFTIPGEQVYYPIVFSEYFPLMSQNKSVGEVYNHFRYEEEFGLWRTFGYGMVSIYWSDLINVGGFDTSIVGWGVEDVDLFDKVRKSKYLHIMRLPEPSLVHVYHDKTCSAGLDVPRRKMCRNSLYGLYSSESVLYKFIMANKGVFDASLELRRLKPSEKKKRERRKKKLSLTRKKTNRGSKYLLSKYHFRHIPK